MPLTPIPQKFCFIGLACMGMRKGKLKNRQETGPDRGGGHAGKQMSKHRHVWAGKQGFQNVQEETKGNPREDTLTHTHPHVRAQTRDVLGSRPNLK